ncbi:hypothetical protein QTL86_03320 [Cellulosilyticum sp. ST5]
MEEGAWKMLSEIYALDKNNVDIKKLTQVCDKIRKLKSMPSGVTEIVWQFQRDKVATSYCRDRLYWLAYQLEKNGISVGWKKL